MECDDFNRLLKINKFVVPFLLCSAVGFFIFYQQSSELIKIEVTHKSISGGEDYVYHINSKSENFVTSEEIYYDLEVGNEYYIGVKGWKTNNTKRRLSWAF